MNVVVDGLMTSYQKIGSGKTIVLLHGWGDTASTFKSLAEQLKNDYELLILDLPGFGGSQAPPMAWNLDDYGDFVKDWLAKLGVKSVFAFVGHSYGGSIIIQGLGSHRLKADKLVLIASAGIRAKNQLRKGLLKVAAKSAKGPLKLLPSAQQRRIRQKIYGAIGSDMLLLPHMEATYKKMINQDVRAAAATISLPTVLIYGDKDKTTPLSDGQILHHALKDSELKVLAGGHFIHHEQPAVVNGIIKDFLV